MAPTFTHPVCDDCWNEHHPSKPSPRVAVGRAEICCHCGKDTLSGIYERRAPNTVNFPNPEGTEEPGPALSRGDDGPQIHPVNMSAPGSTDARTKEGCTCKPEQVGPEYTAEVDCPAHGLSRIREMMGGGVGGSGREAGRITLHTDDGIQATAKSGREAGEAIDRVLEIRRREKEKQRGTKRERGDA